MGVALEVCEEDGSVAGVGGKQEEACEGGGEAGDAGVRIAACTSPASQRLVGDASVDPSGGLHCESISLEACVSVSLSAFELLCVSTCRLSGSPKCVVGRPQQATCVAPPVLMARLK